MKCAFSDAVCAGAGEGRLSVCGPDPTSGKGERRGEKEIERGGNSSLPTLLELANGVVLGGKEGGNKAERVAFRSGVTGKLFLCYSLSLTHTPSFSLSSSNFLFSSTSLFLSPLYLCHCLPDNLPILSKALSVSDIFFLYPLFHLILSLTHSQTLSKYTQIHF